MSRDPVAFLSYVHTDDQHEKGRLTQFRERLSGEVRIQTGEAFEIFQDRNDIGWGQQWKKRIDDSLDGVTFLIPVLTPSFFKSPACRAELERFLKREETLNREDLILPLYYVDCDVLSDENLRSNDTLAQTIAERQYADWRDLRFEPWTAPEVGRMIARLARQIIEAARRNRSTGTGVDASGQSPQPDTFQPKPVAEEDAQAFAEAEIAHGLVPKTQAPILVVDALHRGDHPTIGAALKDAMPGTRILVRPGLYREGIVIDKPIEIIGDGERSDIVIEGSGRNAILFQTDMGRIVNLTIRQAAGGAWYCVNVTQGRLDLEDCDITSQSRACVAIHGGADPRLRRNRIHDSKSSGVFVSEGGQGTLEDNEIFANTFAGVSIKTGGSPTLRRNRIHSGKQSGVLVHDSGRGTLEDNEIFANAYAGVSIKTGGNPTLRRNRIHDGSQSGVYVQENGKGVLENNEIFNNAFTGVSIKTGGDPTLRQNRIYLGKQNGVFVQGNGQGTLEENEIFSNSYSGVLITTEGKPTLRRNRISGNKLVGVRVREGGGGVFEDNDLRENAEGAWDIDKASEANIKQKRNLE